VWLVHWNIDITSLVIFATFSASGIQAQVISWKPPPGAFGEGGTGHKRGNVPGGQPPFGGPESPEPIIVFANELNEIRSEKIQTL
jgi:hypothetical protein